MTNEEKIQKLTAFLKDKRKELSNRDKIINIGIDGFPGYQRYLSNLVADIRNLLSEIEG